MVWWTSKAANYSRIIFGFLIKALDELIIRIL
jgi:hypothetical protein